MSTQTALDAERNLLLESQKKGIAATLGTYVKLSGPGWLQSAITLGGGSLAGSLYLGVLSGMSLLWLQPVAMIMGVIMLSAIGYVTLSTGRRPFRAITQHVNPVLGWGWVLATIMANLVWAMPQFSLATAAIRQNLLPGLLGADAMPDLAGKAIVCIVILIICATVVWFYDTGHKGIKVFEIILKVMVAVIVLSFFGVVLRLSLAGGLEWGTVVAGLIPDLRMLAHPASTFDADLAAVAPAFRDFWTNVIVGQQREVMITAAATAVGINMTFLLPYSMLRRGWDKHFRGLAVFDLATGLFVPFVLATGCVVIASASQFHTQPAPGLLGETDSTGAPVRPAPGLEDRYIGIASNRVKFELGEPAFAALSPEEARERVAALPETDRRMAAMLVQRDAFNLADSLTPLTGDVFAQYVFGLGVVGMATSTIIMLMLINGFAISEIAGDDRKRWAYRVGAFLPAIGILGPFFWSSAQFWLAVPTSMFGMALLPIAYFTFYFLMNQRSLLGDAMPRGGRRLVWNVLMAAAAGIAGLASIWSIWAKTGRIGIGALAAFVFLAIVVQIIRAASPRATEAT